MWLLLLLFIIAPAENEIRATPGPFARMSRILCILHLRLRGPREPLDG